jgi:hypothetical protein
MKIVKYKISLFCLLIFILTISIKCVKIKLTDKVSVDSTNSNKLNSSEKLPDEAKSQPTLNVKVEESDRETSVIKRYNGERKMERDRLRDLEARLQSTKRRFQQIIIMQNLQIAALSNIAQANVKMLNKIEDSPNNIYKPKEEKKS